MIKLSESIEWAAENEMSFMFEMLEDGQIMLKASRGQISSETPVVDTDVESLSNAIWQVISSVKAGTDHFTTFYGFAPQ